MSKHLFPTTPAQAQTAPPTPVPTTAPAAPPIPAGAAVVAIAFFLTLAVGGAVAWRALWRRVGRAFPPLDGAHDAELADDAPPTHVLDYARHDAPPPVLTYTALDVPAPNAGRALLGAAALMAAAFVLANLMASVLLYDRGANPVDTALVTLGSQLAAIFVALAARGALRLPPFFDRPVGPALLLGATAVLVGLPLAYAVGVVGQVVYRWVGYDAPPQEVLLLLRTASPAAVALLALTATVGAPVAEELAFRGCLLRGVALASGSRAIAVVASSALFALIHPLPTWPPIFALALVLGWAYVRTGSLLVPIVVHVAFNAFGTGVTLLLAR